MKKVYYLSSCSTCTRIMSELNLSDFELQDIKNEKITNAQIEEMKNLSGTYENLFSKRAMKYKSLELIKKNLSEEDIKNYILDEYTFLKRPVFVVEDEIFVGNSAKVIEELKRKI